MDESLYPKCRSPRLQGYDYATFGGYFITICTQHRWYLFGTIVEEAMVCNAPGKMIRLAYFHRNLLNLARMEFRRPYQIPASD
jgi:hypothetical protein